MAQSLMEVRIHNEMDMIFPCWILKIQTLDDRVHTVTSVKGNMTYFSRYEMEYALLGRGEDARIPTTEHYSVIYMAFHV